MEPPDKKTGWTLRAYIDHGEALRRADERFDAERDRRYAEAVAARQELLLFKWSADERALLLAREIQNYKDEKANGLRDVIESDRGQHVTRDEWASQHTALADKIETQLKPLNDFMALQQGRSDGISTSTGVIMAVLGFLVALATALILYSSTHVHSVPSPGATVTVTGPPR